MIQIYQHRAQRFVVCHCHHHTLYYPTLYLPPYISHLLSILSLLHNYVTHSKCNMANGYNVTGSPCIYTYTHCRITVHLGCMWHAMVYNVTLYYVFDTILILFTLRCTKRVSASSPEIMRDSSSRTSKDLTTFIPTVSLISGKDYEYLTLFNAAICLYVWPERIVPWEVNICLFWNAFSADNIQILMAAQCTS